MTWRSVAAFIAAPLGALLVMAPLLVDDALAQRPDRDRGAGWARGPDRGDRGKDDWELLGSTRIGGIGLDRDVIDVGRREGRFARIGFEARDGAVFLLNAVVVYGNNDKELINLRQTLREGARTPPIDIKGRDRVIKRIEVTARPARLGRRALLNVYGQKADDWELLGEQKVSRRSERDTIRVGRKEGRFEKIALEVRDNDVEIQDLKVFFVKGPPQDVQVRERIREGGRTRPIDLHGGDRAIDRIELVYRTRGRGERATVAVYGLQGGGGGRGDRGPDRGPDRGGGWEELGCGNVGIKPDRDAIKVGRREGRFSAIQLRVRGNKVNIHDLKVIYDRGPPDDIRVRSEIREGGETRPLDLRGERRVIDRVELTYSIPLGVNLIKGPARVCVFGR